jgi:hypothetical protein
VIGALSSYPERTKGTRRMQHPRIASRAAPASSIETILRGMGIPMSLYFRRPRPYLPSPRQSPRRWFLRPYLDGLEDRMALATAVSAVAHEALAALRHHAALVSAHAASSYDHGGTRAGPVGGSVMSSRGHHAGGATTHHRAGHSAASSGAASTVAPTPTPASASAPLSWNGVAPTLLLPSFDPGDLIVLGL